MTQRWLKLEDKHIDCIVLDYVNETYITDDVPRWAYSSFLTKIWGVQSRDELEFILEGIVPLDWYFLVSDWTTWWWLYSVYPWETLHTLTVPNTVTDLYITFAAGNTWYKLKWVKIRYTDLSWNPQEITTNFIERDWQLAIVLFESYIVNNVTWIPVVVDWEKIYQIDENTDTLIEVTNPVLLAQYFQLIEDKKYVCSTYALREEIISKLQKYYLEFDYAITGWSNFSWHLVTQQDASGTVFEISNDTNIVGQFDIYVDDNIKEWDYFYVKTWPNVNNSAVTQTPWQTVTVEWLISYPLDPNYSYMFMYDAETNDVKLVSKTSLLPVVPVPPLPTPKVRLQPWNPAQPFAIIDRYKYWGNATGGQYKLYNYPEVVTMDLTDEQIAKWVRVEMLVYSRGKSPYNGNTNEDSAYKVPVSWIGWVNTLGNLDTRWGSQSFVGAWALAVDRPNHYQITDRNEVIPVRQYLHNRMSQVGISYNDSVLWQSIAPALTVSQGMRNSWPNYPWSRFWYSSWYRPLYFKFRYIMKADDWYSYISWPLTPTIKLCQEEHPFNFDPVASSITWIRSHKLNPLATPDSARCWFETRLP